MQTLLQIFQDTKEILCRYDYYIHTQKRILHLTNSEIKIPHLMGMQYLGKPGQFTGDYGAYAIKKQRITMDSVESPLPHHAHHATINPRGGVGR